MHMLAEQTIRRKLLMLLVKLNILVSVAMYQSKLERVSPGKFIRKENQVIGLRTRDLR